MQQGEHWMSGVEQVVPFAMIPNGLVKDDRVGVYHIAAFAALATFANRGGECWPGVEKLRKLTGIGKNKWPSVIRELEEWGWLEVVPRYGEHGTQLSNKYRLHNTPSLNGEREGPQSVTHPLPEKGDKQEPSEQEPSNKKIAEAVLEYLKAATGKNFGAHGWKDSHRKYILGRLNEGYTVDDCKSVIDKKVAEWKGTKMDQHLNFETLFRPANFEKYLNSDSAAMTAAEKSANELISMLREG